MAVISQGGESSGFLTRFRGAVLGSGLGVIVVGVGILLIGIGWNGMAGGGGEINGVPNLNAQLPWLVSGGVLGLAFVVFGSALLVAHNARVDRARLEAKLDDMAAALDRSIATPEPAATHRPQPRTSPAARVASAPNAAAEESAVTVVPAKKAAPAKRAPAKRAPAKKTASRRTTG